MGSAEIEALRLQREEKRKARAENAKLVFFSYSILTEKKKKKK